ncbi:PglL family O-oligosaccharyltransferase [Vibrio sp. La 4.2.2]|uniref:PglL family O-oligosaccharyltransferase n=1 Tax=unclassified Vibrio TaxID=2614977 RepID=UPI001F294401|nr:MULTISPECIES: PglL family O-oligosaccharyltransferase [unclassified Vibrio]MCF4171944.1 PglL family O-oligosaccharyltransferase [Vibrio sp. McD22-P3]MDA0109721.1 PglL family O-oligosaccharyltransferase [Vibrio sp. La 4.2.2]
MAIIHTNGTELAENRVRPPLNRKFMAAMAMLYLIATHVFWPNPGGLGLALTFNNTAWIAFSVALAIGLYQLGSNQILRYSKLTIGLLLSCILLSTPLFYSKPDIISVAPRFIALWSGMLLFIVLQQFQFTNKQKQRFLWLVVLAALIESAIGYGQYFLLSDDNFMGYDVVINRPYGIFQQPNVMASFLATALVLSGYLLARQRHKYNWHISDVSILYLTPVITLPLIVVLGSRTGWLGALIGTLLLIPYLYRHSTRKRFRGWTFASLAGVALGLFLGFGNTSSQNLIEQKASFTDIRATIYSQSIDMLIEKPFTGYGLGKFEPEYMVYTARQHQLNNHFSAGVPALDHPQNELLFWGIEGGLLPILGILLAALFVLSRIYTAKPGTRLAIFALFLPIVLHSQLEYPFYHSLIHWITFIILIYWVDQRTPRLKQASLSGVTKTLTRVMSLLIPILVTTYMVASLHTNYVLNRFEKSDPVDATILEKVSNPMAWQDRYDWDVYSTYLKLGLRTGDKTLIQPYIDWSVDIIRHKPRPAFYRNLILAYQGIGDTSKAQQVKTEAEYLFPYQQFELVATEPVQAKSQL